MSKETKEDEVIALSTVYQDGSSVRGKIPASVVKALRAKDGDVLAFERQSDGRVLVRKSNAAERKGLASKKGGKK
jgi:antitoxin component of MazEF toxin-antitoxin module